MIAMSVDVHTITTVPEKITAPFLTDGKKYGDIKNGGIGRGSVAMEASWKGGCCGAEQSVCLGFAEAQGRIPVPKTITHRCPNCSCWYKLYSIVGSVVKGRGGGFWTADEVRYNSPPGERKKVHDAKLSKKGFEMIKVCTADAD